MWVGGNDRSKVDRTRKWQGEESYPKSAIRNQKYVRFVYSSYLVLHSLILVAFLLDVVLM